MKTGHPAGTEYPNARLQSAVARPSPIAVPLTSMVPLRLGINPMMVRISTDFPPPEAPTSRGSRPCGRRATDGPAQSGGQIRRRGRVTRIAGWVATTVMATFRSMQRTSANTPSSTMTRKIDFTTEAVVCRPSDSALPLTRSPSPQATMPITSAMNGALIMPTSKCVTVIASCSRAMKIVRAHAAIEPGDQAAAVERRHRPRKARIGNAQDQRDDRAAGSAPRPDRDPWCAARRSPRASSSSRVRPCRSCRSGRRP